MLSRSRPAKILSGRPICGPEALLQNIGCDLDPAAVGPHAIGDERPGEWERTPGGSGNEGPGNSGSEGPGAPPVSTRTPAPKYKPVYGAQCAIYMKQQSISTMQFRGSVANG